MRSEGRVRLDERGAFICKLLMKISSTFSVRKGVLRKALACAMAVAFTLTQVLPMPGLQGAAWAQEAEQDETGGYVPVKDALAPLPQVSGADEPAGEETEETYEESLHSTPLAPATDDPTADFSGVTATHDRYTMSQAVEEFKAQDAAVALVLGHAPNAEELKHLFTLDPFEEIAGAVLHGEVVLFNTNREREVGATERVEEIIRSEAEVVFHTHKSQTGPSQFDKENALEGRGLEYVVSPDGVVGYDRAGKEVHMDFEAFAEVLGEAWRKAEAERDTLEARNLLNELVVELERLRHEAEEIVSYRHENQPPRFVNLPETVNVMEGDTLKIPVRVHDPDNDSIQNSVTYILNGVPQAALPAGVEWRRDPETTQWMLVWWPWDQAGTHEFLLRAVDEAGASVEQKVTVNVAERVRTPGMRIMIEPVYAQFETLTQPVVAVAYPWEGPVRLRIDAATVYSNDPNEITLTVEGARGASFGYQPSHWRGPGKHAEFYWNPTDVDPGLHTVSFKATDKQGNSTEIPVQITVGPLAARDTVDHVFPQVEATGADIFYDKSNGLGHAVVSGVVKLGAVVGAGNQGDIGQSGPLSSNVEFRIFLHKSDRSVTPITPYLKGAETFSYDTSQLPEGHYALSIEMKDAVNDSAGRYFEGWAMTLIVDRDGKPQSGPVTVPVLGARMVYSDWWQPQGQFSIDWVTVSDSGQKTVHPYPYVLVPLPQSDGERARLISPDAWWAETTTQAYPMREDTTRVLYKTKEGHLVDGAILFQGSGCVEEPIRCSSLAFAERMPAYDGPRGVNSVHEYSVYVPDPESTGFIGLSPSGRIFRVGRDGTVTTLVGPYTPSGVILPHPVDFNVSAHQEIKGTYENNLFLQNPSDIAFDPFDSKILYAADANNHRIAKIDFHGQTPVVTTYAGVAGSAGYVEGARGEAKFNGPRSIALDPRDGTMYVADKENLVIRKITRDGMVTTVAGKGPGSVPPGYKIIQDIERTYDASTAGYNYYLYTPESVSLPDALLYHPGWVRLDSKGNPIVGEFSTGAVRRVDLAKGTVERLTSNKEWGPVTFDVDDAGSSGPVDDLLVLRSHSVRYNDQIWRVSSDGSRDAIAYSIENFFPGCNTNGNCDNSYGGGFDSFPLSAALDDESSAFIMGGHNRFGVAIFRPVQPADPTASWYGHDRTAYVNGRAAYVTGTVPKFHHDPGDALLLNNGSLDTAVRPSFQAVHGALGSNYVGDVKQFDDLTGMTHAQLAEFIRNGMGGGETRPEFDDGPAMRDLVYFLRLSSLEGRTTPVRWEDIQSDLTREGYVFNDAVAPEVRNLRAEYLDPANPAFGVRLMWQTDELALGFVEFGTSNLYGRHTGLETGYAKDHVQLLTDLDLKQTHQLLIRMKDRGGNFTVLRDVVLNSLLPGIFIDANRNPKFVNKLAPNPDTYLLQYSVRRWDGSFEEKSKIFGLVEGANSFSAEEPDGRGGLFSATHTVIRDTVNPSVSAIELKDLSARKLNVSFKTDEKSTARVEYGPTANYGIQSAATAPGLDHAVGLTGLSPSTTYHYRIVATDEAGNRTYTEDQTFVTPATSAPEFDPIANQKVDEGKELKFTVVAKDADGDSLRYSATGLPQGASLNEESGVFAWTPTYKDAGTYSLTFSVTDGQYTAQSGPVTITVNDINRAPVLQPVGSQKAYVGRELKITLQASDPDGDGLGYSVSPLLQGASFDSNTGVFKWTPAANQLGLHELTFTVTDAKGEQVSEKIKIGVLERTARFDVVDGILGLAAYYDFNGTALDGKGPNDGTVTGAAWVDGKLGKALQFKEGDTVTIPDHDSLTPKQITFAAFIKPENTVNSYIAQKGASSGESFAVRTNLEQLMVDLRDDAGSITRFTAGSLKDGEWNHIAMTWDNALLRLYVNGEEVGSAPFAGSALNNGSLPLHIGSTIYKNFSFSGSIDDVLLYNRALKPEEIKLLANQPPKAQAQSVTTNEDTAKAITLTGTDKDGDPLTYSIVMNPSHGGLGPITKASDGTHTVKYTPAENFNGSDSFTFKVNDGQADSETAAVSLTINPVNDAPVISNMLSEIEAREGEAVVIPFGVFEPDNDIVNYFVGYLMDGVVQTSLPPGASLVVDPETTAHSLGWWPGLNQAGNYQFRFTAVDEHGATAEQTISVTVTDATDAPAIKVSTLDSYGNAQPPLASPASLQVRELGKFQVRIDVADPEGDPVTLEVKGIPAATMTLDHWGPNTASWGWYTNSSDAGIYQGAILATDSHGHETQVPLTLDVRNVWTYHELRYALPTGSEWLTGSVPVLRGAAVPLDLVFQDDDQYFHSTPGLSLQYLLDNEPISPLLTDSYKYTWNTTSIPDGTHVLSVRFVDGPDLDQLRSRPSQVVVDNIAGPVTGPQRVPITGFHVNETHDSPAVDWVTYSGTREHATGHPYPYQPVPPAHALPDPSTLLDLKNWFLEPLTEGISGLYEASPTFYSTRSGDVVTAGFYAQSGKSSEAAVDHAQRHDHFDGERNDNSVCPYTTFVANPQGPGWIAVDISGRVFRIDPNGTVTTIAGRVTDRDVLPYDFRDAGIPLQELYDHQKITIGSFADGVLFNMPNDLAFDPRDPGILYIADTGNHRIAKIDLHGQIPVITTYAGMPGQAGYQDGSATQAKFNEPYSLAVASDGTIYVADKDNSVIRKISPDGSTVTTLVGKGSNAPPVPDKLIVRNNRDAWIQNAGFDAATVTYPQVIRLDSNENIVVGEEETYAIRKIDLINRRVEKIANVPGNPGDWMWLDVDRKGNIGPRDDILWTSSTGPGNREFWRISQDGSRIGKFLPGDPSTALVDGNASVLGEAGGHYSWAATIDDKEARFITTGFGTAAGPNSFRMALPTDPVVAYDYYAYGRGQEIYTTGSVPGFPFGSRPGLNLLHGPRGHSRLGNLPNFDDLAALPDQELADYIHDGMGGSVPRPEITGNDLRALIYFIRRNSLQGNTSDVRPGPLSDDARSPEIRNVIVTQIGTGAIKVAWQTDEPTYGGVHYNPGDPGLHDDALWQFQSGSSHSKDHEAVLTDLVAGKTYHFQIRSKDLAGNLTGTRDRQFNPSELPPNHAPVVQAQSVTTNEGTPKAITLAGSDEDADPLTFSIVTDPKNGKLVKNDDGTYTFTPNKNFNGSDSFTFEVNDGKVDSEIATVSLTVNSVNDAPVITLPKQIVAMEGEAISFNFSAVKGREGTAALVDPDDTIDQLEYFVERIDGSGKVLAMPQGAGLVLDKETAETRFIWWPDLTQAGAYDFRFKAVDERGASAEEKVTVTVEDRNNTPAIQFTYPVDYGNGPSLPSGGRVVVQETGLFRARIGVKDPEGDPVTLAVSGIPATLSLGYYGPDTADLSWYTGYQDAGVYQVTVTATDSKGHKTEFPLTLEVRNSWHYDEAAYARTTFTSDGKQIAGTIPVVRGTVDLSTGFKTGYFGTPVESDATFRYVLHTPESGYVLSEVLTTADRFTWDTTKLPDGKKLPDGTYALSVDLIDGSELDRLHARLMTVVVDNEPGPVLGEQWIPVVGHEYISYKEPAVVDWVKSSGHREHARSHPYPSQKVAAAHELPDPSVLLKAENWFVEPLTQSISGLYQSSPTFYTTPEGHLFIAGHYAQVASTSEGAVAHVKRHDHYDGERDDNSVCPYATYVSDPVGDGWVGVDLSGRVFRVDPDGKVTTIAGRVTSRDVLPFDYRDLGIDINKLYDHQKLTVGDFADGLLFKMPNDLAFDPRDPKILYIADTGNHRIAKIDSHGKTPVITTLAGIPGEAGYQDGPARQAKLNSPYSLTVSDDGTIYVADKENSAIRKITPDGTVSTVVGKGSLAPPVPDKGTVAREPEKWTGNGDFDRATVTYPQVIRVDSKGNLIVGEDATQTIRRIDLKQRRVEKIVGNVWSGGNWMWLDVDRKGVAGPKDDILVASATGGAGNTEFWRISADGSRSARAVQGGGTGLFDGVASQLGEAAGHYPWAVVFHDEQARFVTTGFGSSGLISFRMALPDDPKGWPGMPGDIGRGQQIYRSGTVPEFPWDSRPSFSALHGPQGHSRLGNVANFDDLTEPLLSGNLDEAGKRLFYKDLAETIRGGFGGRVPRPELTGRNLYSLILFILRSSLYGNLKEVNPQEVEEALTWAGLYDSEDQRAPEIRNVQVVKVDETTVKVRWQTDEATIGLIKFGATDYYGLASKIEDSYSKYHDVEIREVSASGHFSILSKDLAGNLTNTWDGQFNPSELPPNRPPKAQAQSVTTDEDTAKVITSAGTDADDGDKLTFSIVTDPKNGELVKNAGGTFTFTPNRDFNGSDSFTFKAHDGRADSAEAKVTVNITAVNDAPVFQALVRDQKAAVGEVTTITLKAQDVDGDAVRFESVSLPAFASLKDNGDGTATVTVDARAGDDGVYSIKVRAFDGSLEAVADLTLAVFPEIARQEKIITPHDKIPNFGRMDQVTRWAVKSGDWSDASVWSGGKAPAEADVVALLAGVGIVVDTTQAIAKTVVIHRGAKLSFKTDADTKLAVGTLLVLEGGTLEVGSAQAPIAASVRSGIVIRDVALDLSDDAKGIYDPEQYGTGVIGLGKVTMHGAVKTSGANSRLAVEPKVGDNTLTLEEPVTGWRPGDRLILPDTRQLDWNERGNSAGPYVPQWEELQIASMSPDGKTITLTSTLEFDHLGARNLDGVLEFLPHISNLSRNILVHSENPSGTRGHFLMTHRADVDIAYASFYDLGRTKIDPIDNTTFNPDGTVAHVGENESWRYMALHMHHLIGPAAANPDGYQYKLRGNSVFDNSDSNDKIWGIAIHDSHYGLIKDNFVYNAAGAGVATEDGSESFNTIERNFVVRVSGTGDRLSNGRDGVGFWFRGPNNYVRDNVATNINASGTYSYGFNVWALHLGSVKVPLFPGADPTVEGQYRVIDMNATPLLEFARNEVYGATPNGLTLWWLGMFGTDPKPGVGPSVVKDFRAWHIFRWGYFGYEAQNLVLDGFVIRGGTANLRSENWGDTGMWFGDYLQKGVVIRNADIQGMQMGILLPGRQDGLVVVENSFLRNQTNIINIMMNSVNGADGLTAKETLIRNVRFAAPAGMPLRTIAMSYSLVGAGTFGAVNLVQRDEVRVEDYNGDPAADFQVFYKEQHPDFIVPQTGKPPGAGRDTIGSPEAGLTNAQNWAKYGIAIAGAIAPSDAIDGKDRNIDGLVAPRISDFQLASTKYLGGFLVPNGSADKTSFHYGGTAIAYDPTSNGLFMTGHDWYQLSAAISIPQLVNSSSVNNLNTAALLQSFADVTDGKISGIDPDIGKGEGGKIGGMLVYNGKLITTAYTYYDGSGNAVSSHFVSGLDLSNSTDAQGPFRVGTANPGAVGGYMAAVPQDMQSLLGGPAVTGQCCISIISRASFGAALFAFDPNALGVQNPAPAMALVHYPQNQQPWNFDGAFDPSTNLFNAVTRINGVFMDDTSQSVIFVGSQGLGAVCYKEAPCTNGGGYGVVPGSGGGPNDYVTGLWVYKASDLAKVKDGTLQPWQVRPSAWYQLDLPIAGHSGVGGVAYDPATARLFISQMGPDRGTGFGSSPVVHVYQLNGTPPPNRAPLAQAQSVTLNEDIPTAITLAGTGEDGAAVTFSIVSHPKNGTLEKNANGTMEADPRGTTKSQFIYIPTENFNGSDSFTFRAHDGKEFSTAATVSLTVKAVNDAPVLAAIGEKKAAEGEKIEFAISGSDVDGDPLTYSATGLPQDATFDASTRTFTWTPAAGQAGSHQVTFKVSDGALSAEETVLFTVSQTDVTPPQITELKGPPLTNALEVLMSWKATDEGSGIAAYRWRVKKPDGTATAWTEQTNDSVTLKNEVNLEGAYTFELLALDKAGNSSTVASHAFTTDRNAPLIIVDRKTPSELSKMPKNASITIKYTADGVKKEKTFTGLVYGENKLVLTERDEAGNESSVTWLLTIKSRDRIVIDPKTPTLTNSHTLTVKYTVETEEGNRSGEKTFSDLADGDHTLHIEDEDSTASWRLRVDTQKPQIKEARAAHIRSSGARMEFEADEPSLWRLEWGVTEAYGRATNWTRDPARSGRLDLSDLEPTTLYYVRLHARDEAGNEAAPATFTFRSREVGAKDEDDEDQEPGNGKSKNKKGKAAKKLIPEVDGLAEWLAWRKALSVPERHGLGASALPQKTPGDDGTTAVEIPDHAPLPSYKRFWKPEDEKPHGPKEPVKVPKADHRVQAPEPKAHPVPKPPLQLVQAVPPSTVHRQAHKPIFQPSPQPRVQHWRVGTRVGRLRHRTPLVKKDETAGDEGWLAFAGSKAAARSSQSRG